MTPSLPSQNLLVVNKDLMVVLLSLLLLLISENETLSPVAGVVAVILFGFIVTFVGTNGSPHSVVVCSSV
jgi:hypothetical protein